MFLVGGVIVALTILGACIVIWWAVRAWFAVCDWLVLRRYRNTWRHGQLPRADIRPAQRRGRR